MKIIISPSKTQAMIDVRDDLNQPIYYGYTKKILHELKSYKKSELAQVMRINGKLLDKVFQELKQIKVKPAHVTPAIRLYTGITYDCFKIENFNEIELAYMNQNLRIISAMYGVLCPMDGVQTYRLDFTMKLKTINLNALWKDTLCDYFRNEELIIDCASTEFSHFLSPIKDKVHRIEFIDVVDGQAKIISYNVKKLRGMLAHYCIKHQIKDVNCLKNFCEEGYLYQSDRSDAMKSVFMRKVS